jgi:hypothetical protein
MVLFRTMLALVYILLRTYDKTCDELRHLHKYTYFFVNYYSRGAPPGKRRKTRTQP